jgi:hypothetical protein
MRRIVHRIYPRGEEYFVVQKHFVFGIWFDEYQNRGDHSCLRRFETLEEAKEYVNISNKKIEDIVVWKEGE